MTTRMEGQNDEAGHGSRLLRPPVLALVDPSERPMGRMEPKEARMNAPKPAEEEVPGSELPAVIPERIPLAIRKAMESTPPKLWPKLRPYLIESEEEGELIEMLPEMNRVMRICPNKLSALVRKRKISGQTFGQGFAQLHEALHGVRQAMYALLHLAGCKVEPPPDPEKPEDPLAGSDPQPGSAGEPESAEIPLAEPKPLDPRNGKI